MNRLRAIARTVQPSWRLGVRVAAALVLALATVAVGQVVSEAPDEELHGVNVYYFWGDGCPVCAQQRGFLDWLVENYPEVEVYDFEVYYEIPNRALLEALSAAFGEPVRAVPVTFIGEHAWIGFSQTIATQMLASIERYRTYEAPDAADLIDAELRERFLPEEEEQP